MHRATRRVARARYKWAALGLATLFFGVSCHGTDEPRPPEVLATGQVIGAGSVHAIVSQLFFALDLTNTATACHETGVAIFYPSIIRNGDTGRTLVADASNSPSFGAFASLLTDGVDETVIRCVGIEGVGSGGEGNTESVFFGRTVGGIPDFRGYAIDRVEFQIDSVSMVSPGSDLEHDGVWTDYYLAGRVLVWGHR